MPEKSSKTLKAFDYDDRFVEAPYPTEGWSLVEREGGRGVWGVHKKKDLTYLWEPFELTLLRLFLIERRPKDKKRPLKPFVERQAKHFLGSPFKPFVERQAKHFLGSPLDSTLLKSWLKKKNHWEV